METKPNQLQGGKEIGLFELKKHSCLGYSVPDFFVLPDLENEEKLKEIFEEFKDNDIIVRSNSIMENSKFGFDGIYNSVVVKNWDFESLKIAYKQVLDSLFSEDAILYRAKLGITEDSMRIIVQKFIGNKGISNDEELEYFVMETSINAQGDMSLVIDRAHDFINQNRDYEEIIICKDGKIITSTSHGRLFKMHKILCLKLKTIAVKLQKIFGPVSLEGAYIKNVNTGEVEIFLFQRRLLLKEIYQAEPEIVPEKYKKEDILFSSSSYRGSGKIENLPVVVMPMIQGISTWEDDLRKKISQLNSDIILFVSTMRLGHVSSRILNDYSVLSRVKAIISHENIEFLSHSFKVASLARIPFVSAKKFSRISTLSTGSLFFTNNKAVFCLDKNRQEFDFNSIQKSEAISLVELVKGKSVVVEFSEENRTINFRLNLKKFSFKEFEIAFHRLLEDISGEVWFFKNNFLGNIGFQFENSKGHTVQFSGWANYMLKEGGLRLDNFEEYFEKNKIDWSLVQAIFYQLNSIQ